MESDEREVKALLAPLREERPELEASRREAVWAKVQAARKPARPPLLPWLLTAAVATAAVALWLRSTEPEPVPQAPAVTTLAQGATIEAGGELPSGARIEVEGRVEVAEATAQRTRLRLAQGRVFSRVPKLAPGEAYVVDTPLAQVSVKGTRFSVERLGEAVEVQVEEGLVEVAPRDGRPARLLPAGKRWRVEPLTSQGAEAAAAREDWGQALDIRQALAMAMPDGLPRRNALLAAGRIADAKSPLRAQRWWAQAAAAHPRGTHAEEFAFRAADALRQAGKLPEARRAAEALRAAFPDSQRARETARW